MHQTPSTSSQSYVGEPFVIEPHTARLLRDGVPVEIEPKVFELIEHRDRLVGMNERLDTV